MYTWDWIIKYIVLDIRDLILNTKCRCPTQYPRESHAQCYAFSIGQPSPHTRTPHTRHTPHITLYHHYTPSNTHTHTQTTHTSSNGFANRHIYGRALCRMQRISIITASGNRELHSQRQRQRPAWEQASSTWRQLLKCFSSDNILAVSRANSAECL